MKKEEQESLDNEYERLSPSEFCYAAIFLMSDYTFLKFKKGWESLKNRFWIA